jgi:hypothetical protein
MKVAISMPGRATLVYEKAILVPTEQLWCLAVQFWYKIL